MSKKLGQKEGTLFRLVAASGPRWTYSRSQGVGPAILRGKLLNTERGRMGGIPGIRAMFSAQLELVYRGPNY